MSLPKPAYVVLGMLGYGFRSGYEISKKAAISTRFFWAASDGQIYPQLRRLAEAGLIEGETETQGERQRNVFELTAAGRRELEDWLTAPGPTAHELRDEGLLKLFFAEELRVEQLLGQVRNLRDQHARTLEQLAAIEGQAHALGLAAPLVVLRTGQTVHGALHDFYAALEADLAGHDPDGRAGDALAAVLAAQVR